MWVLDIMIAQQACSVCRYFAYIVTHEVHLPMVGQFLDVISSRANKFILRTLDQSLWQSESFRPQARNIETISRFSTYI